MVTTSGAPRDQGRDQGEALRQEIRETVRRVRRRQGLLGWRLARHRVGRGPGRALQRFLPQQHERLQGVAVATRVPIRSLETCAVLERIPAAGAVPAAATLYGRVEPAFALVIRRSEPDAGGFPSVELTAPAWAGCLAGVNAEGVAVLCIDDSDLGAPPLRLLAQDALFRTRTLSSALDHLRRRALYLRASGSLVVVDADAGAARLLLRNGEVEVGEPDHGLTTRPTLTLDARSRSLTWTDREGAEHKASASPGG